MPAIYITEDDITNKTFNRQTDTAKATYLSHANAEIEDMAIRLNVPIASIVTPIHYKIKRYAVQYALSVFAEDNIGFNNEDKDNDKYKDLFKRCQYLMQESRPSISSVMFTGEAQTGDNRSVRSIRLVGR